MIFVKYSCYICVKIDKMHKKRQFFLLAFLLPHWLLSVMFIISYLICILVAFLTY